MNHAELSVPDLKAHATSASRSIGAILIDNGFLSPENAERVLRSQKETGQRFGDAAIALGLLTEDDINLALARQFDYPYLPATDTSLSDSLVAAYKPFSPVVERLRALRSQLILRLFSDSRVRSNAISIVSPDAKEGRSFVAANLAIVFSQLGERTLLIDADLRKPCQHHLFKMDSNPGLSGILSGRAGIEAVAHIPSLLGLSLLPSGAIPPNPQELLGRSGFTELLQSLGRIFDVMIIDTPPAIQCAEAQIISARATAALLLARKNYSSAPEMRRLAKNLQHSGVTLAGSVLNEY